MRSWVVDRIEGKFAVCYGDGVKVDIPLSRLPRNVRPGMTVLEDAGEYTADILDTQARHNRIQEKFSRLRRENQGGNYMRQYTTTREKTWFAPEPIAMAPTATLSPGHHEQTWMGFGGCFNELGHLAVLTLRPEVKSQLLDNLFSKILTACGLIFAVCPWALMTTPKAGTPSMRPRETTP